MQLDKEVAMSGSPGSLGSPVGYADERCNGSTVTCFEQGSRFHL